MKVLFVKKERGYFCFTNIFFGIMEVLSKEVILYYIYV